MNVRASIRKWTLGSVAVSSFLLATGVTQVMAQNQKPNVVILMTDDTGWNDFGAYGGGANLAIRPPTSIRSPRKAPSSPVGTARQVAPRAGPRS